MSILCLHCVYIMSILCLYYVYIVSDYIVSTFVSVLQRCLLSTIRNEPHHAEMLNIPFNVDSLSIFYLVCSKVYAIQ